MTTRILYTEEFKSAAIMTQQQLESYGIETHLVFTDKGWEVREGKETENGSCNTNC